MFQTKVKLLGHDIYKENTVPIDRAIKSTYKFLDEMKDRKQFQRFLGSLNHIFYFYKNLAKDCEPLYKRLMKNPSTWFKEHTKENKK